MNSRLSLWVRNGKGSGTSRLRVLNSSHRTRRNGDGKLKQAYRGWMTHMGEVVSEDMLDWARDLAAIQKLLAGETLAQSAVDAVVVSPRFGWAQSGGSDLRLPRGPQPRPDSRQASA